MKHNGYHRPDNSWVDFSFRAPQYTLRFFCMAGEGLFYLDVDIQNPNVSNFSKDEAEWKEKYFNFTHRCKSLNCFKLSVTWREELSYIGKQRLEASKYVRQKVMKIVVIFFSLFNSMQLIPLFRGPCLTTEDISKNNRFSKTFVKFCANGCMTCLAKWVPWSLEIVEKTFFILKY